MAEALEYYDIMLVGRTGMGKSTTANKLLDIEESTGNPVGERIKFWGEREDKIKYFITGGGAESVTGKCLVLSDEKNKIRVLDTPGFADFELTKEHGLMESNLQIFRWILKKQEKFDLTFRRVLYFLPTRGPPERADGTLQEEIKVMYEFLGQDIFNIMVIVATNRKKYQMDLDEEEIEEIKQVFSVAFAKATDRRLEKCPPILYLKFAETCEDLVTNMMNADVISEGPLKRKKRVQSHDIPEMVRNAVRSYPGEKMRFQDRCTRCAGRLYYEDSPTGKRGIKVVNKNNIETQWEQSKCHPIFIQKYSKGKKVLGGIAHAATFGMFVGFGALRGKTIWPGFTNSDEICPVCRLSPGSDGCTDVGVMANISTEEEARGYIMTKHSVELDS